MMNVNNLTYAVARATDASRETGEETVVGYLRDKNTFCVAQTGQELEWSAACDQNGLVAFDCDQSYAQWAMALEAKLQAHIAATEVSGDLAYIDEDGIEFVEV